MIAIAAAMFPIAATNWNNSFQIALLALQAGYWPIGSLLGLLGATTFRKLPARSPNSCHRQAAAKAALPRSDFGRYWELFALLSAIGGTP
jgi:hypothetical protein